jgi:hypothetical protein
MSCENEGIFYKLSIVRDKFRSTTIEERKKEKILQNRWHTNRRSNSAQPKKKNWENSIIEECQAVN